MFRASTFSTEQVFESDAWTSTRALKSLQKKQISVEESHDTAFAHGWQFPVGLTLCTANRRKFWMTALQPIAKNNRSIQKA